MLARTVLLGVGLIVALMGTLWAMQGAYLIPATFMRGPDWIAIGAGTALAGVAMVAASFWLKKREAKPAAPSVE